ncbi:hypothetical protein ACFS2C_01190 [Prauserella oleivorans]|uniref:Secreted protein n=1 Tax=Prauserella oleivorans TaxID=1478153 RepID=A0ABW5W529_9PSEU
MGRSVRGSSVRALFALTVVPVVLALVPAPAEGRAASRTWTVAVPRSAPAAPFAVHDVAPTRLDIPVNTVTATPAAGTTVDVRSLRPDGMWSEWTPTPAVLPESHDVQVRLVHTAASGPGTVTLTAWRDPAARPRAARMDTFRIFATREGLVGGTTANGHVIRTRDHFVALPSRRGLASRSGGEYTVRVCTVGGHRCAWAPVWDVGPWNITDDHWNVARQSWRDLPHGLPQAQAAYQDGYHGGKDQFGRRVRNPAGIDLADGTFWDALGLAANSWVDVTYQWTGSGPWGTVETPGWALKVRAAPNAGAAHVGYAARHARVRVDCHRSGQQLHGTQGTTTRWYRLAPGKYVSAAYVRPGLAAAAC